MCLITVLLSSLQSKSDIVFYVIVIICHCTWHVACLRGVLTIKPHVTFIISDLVMISKWMSKCWVLFELTCLSVPISFRNTSSTLTPKSIVE